MKNNKNVTINLPPDDDDDDKNKSLNNNINNHTMNSISSSDHKVMVNKENNVSEAELLAAFEFFSKNEKNSSGENVITLDTLKSRLGAFYTNIPNREYSFLMNNKQEVSLEDLRELLQSTVITNFDPVAEAFKVYDPEGTGYVEENLLRDIFKNLDFGDISQEDMAILIETADSDKDGKISLEDFRTMLDVSSSTSNLPDITENE